MLESHRSRVTRTTSLRQGRSREGGSGGSVRLSSRRSPAANLRADGQKRHRRPGFLGELAQHNVGEDFPKGNLMDQGTG